MVHPRVLARIQNSALKTDQDEQPLTLAEVFRGLTDGIWNEFPAGGPRGEDKRPVSSSIIRRNLQREHLKDLSNLVLGPRPTRGGGFYFFQSGSGGNAPPDARSLARMHLREISKRIDAALKDKPANLDDTTRAHLEECHEGIAKVMNASLQVNEP